MRWIALLALLAPLALAQGVVLTHLWTSPPRLAVPIGLAVSESGAVLLTDTPVSGGGNAILFAPSGAVLSGLFYAQGVGSASYANNTFAFVTLAGNVMFMAPNGTVVKTVPVSPSAALMLSLSPSGKEFVVCHVVCEAYSGSHKVWTFKGVKEVTSPPAWVGDVVYVPDGGAKKVYALDAKTGKVLYSLAYNKPVYAIAACKDVLAVGVGKEVYLYSVAKGFPQLQAKAELGAPVNDVAFSRDCNVMLVASGNNLAVLDRNGKVLSKVNLGADVMLVSWKGDYVAVATVDSAGVERVSLYQAYLTQGTPKTRYKLSFKQVNAQAVFPLTYPNPNGVVFVLARTAGGDEVWTLINGTVVGKVKVPREALFVEDTRAGEVATYHNKLLVVYNDTLYELFGSAMKPIMRLRTNSQYSTFIKVGDKIYAVEVNVTKGKDYTNVTCGFRALGSSSERVYRFSLPANVTARVVADAIDAKGCAVTWVKGPYMYYQYEGENGKASGKVSLFNAVGAGFMFLEVRKGETHPFAVYAVPTDNGMVRDYFVDVLSNRTLKFDLPALYNLVGVGDYLGEGYYGDVAFLALNRNNFHYELIVINTKNITRTYDLGRIGRTLAVVSGLALHEGYLKNVFGLGNLNGLNLDVRTNVGTLKFAISGVTLVPSTMNLLLTLTSNKMCYTAAINPLTPGGNVYLATGCLPR